MLISSAASGRLTVLLELHILRETNMMMPTLTACLLCLVAQDDAGRPPASLPPVPYRVAAPDRNDAGVLLYYEMQRRLNTGAVATTSGYSPSGMPLLDRSRLEIGEDASTQIAVELLRARLRLAELQVIATRRNPERAALRERIETLESMQRRLRREGMRPNRWLLVRNRERLLEQLEENFAVLRDDATRRHPLRRPARRLATALARILR